MVEFIGIDLETGGLSSDRNAILTCYMSAVNEHLEVLDEIHLFIRPEAPFDAVEEKALKVNNIDLAKHVADPSTITYAQARTTIRSFMQKHGNAKKGSKHTKPMVIGHNVHFDLGFIFTQLADKKEWEKYFGYHVMDTMVACTLLKKVGWLPPEVGKLESLVKHFGVQNLGAHDAKADTLMMLNVFGKMVNMIKDAKKNAGGNSLDLLSMLEK